MEYTLNSLNPSQWRVATGRESQWMRKSQQGRDWQAELECKVYKNNSHYWDWLWPVLKNRKCWPPADLCGVLMNWSSGVKWYEVHWYLSPLSYHHNSYSRNFITSPPSICQSSAEHWWENLSYYNHSQLNSLCPAHPFSPLTHITNTHSA